MNTDYVEGAIVKKLDFQKKHLTSTEKFTSITVGCKEFSSEIQFSKKDFIATGEELEECFRNNKIQEKEREEVLQKKVLYCLQMREHW